MDGSNQQAASAQQNVPAPTTPASEATAMLQMIKEVATTPGVNVEAIRAMLDMQRQLTQDQSERAMNESLARLILPHVKKNGKIPLPSKDGATRDVAFAKWEDVDTVIRPLLMKEGLSLSFTAPPRQADGGGAAMVGRLSHVQGAFREAEISLPLDSGPGRNNLQAMGSTISYGKKYLAFMLLNIVTEGEDDDGKGANEVIDNARAVEIDLLITEVKADKANS
jgi:ERF superfamily